MQSCGYEVMREGIGREWVERLRSAVEAIDDPSAARRSGVTFGVRNLLDLSADVRALAVAPEIRRCGAGGFD